MVQNLFHFFIFSSCEKFSLFALWNACKITAFSAILPFENITESTFWGYFCPFSSWLAQARRKKVYWCQVNYMQISMQIDLHGAVYQHRLPSEWTRTLFQRALHALLRREAVRHQTLLFPPFVIGHARSPSPASPSVPHSACPLTLFHRDSSHTQNVHCQVGTYEMPAEGVLLQIQGGAANDGLESERAAASMPVPRAERKLKPL
jgi:hypothetical protein